MREPGAMKVARPVLGRRGRGKPLLAIRRLEFLPWYGMKVRMSRNYILPKHDDMVSLGF